MVSTTGLVAYWPFDNESLKDFSGNGRDLTNVTNLAFAPGSIGIDLSFVDRTVIRAAYGNLIDMSAWTSLSIAWECNKTAAATASVRVFQFALSNTDGIRIMCQSGTNTIQIGFFRAGFEESVTAANAFDATIRQYALTFDLASKAWILYRDGVSFANGNLTNTPVMPNRNLVIGNNDPSVLSATVNWLGLIGKVRLYSRVLTLAEVADLSTNPSQRVASGTSSRYLVLAAVTSALSDINATATSSYVSTINTVSPQIRNYKQISPDAFPAVFPIDTNEIKSHASFNGAEDMTSELTITVTSMLYDPSGVTSIARTDLLRDIEKAMETASQLSNISGVNVWHVHTERVLTDQGTIPCYSIHDQFVQINYTYQSTTGG